MKLETLNNVYEVVNYERTDGKYNVYVQKTSKLTGVYKGEATYSLGCSTMTTLELADVVDLSYEIY